MALSYLATILGVVALATANVNITSPPVTNWGVWGNFQRCPFGRSAQGFQLKTEPNQYLGDDTALNSVRIFCGDPFRPDTAAITSTVGDFGDWGNVYTCFPGVLTGFQLRSESERPGSGDDSAANNIRFYCSNFEDPNRYIEGDGMSWGDWSQSQRCYSNQAICGIQTQVEPYLDSGDDTMLNNVRFECCDVRKADLDADKKRAQELGGYPQSVSPEFAAILRKAVAYEQKEIQPGHNNNKVHFSSLAKAALIALQEEQHSSEKHEASTTDLHQLAKAVSQVLKQKGLERRQQTTVDLNTLTKSVFEILEKHEAAARSQKETKVDLPTMAKAVSEVLKKHKLEHSQEVDLKELSQAVSVALNKHRSVEPKKETASTDIRVIAKAVAEVINNKKSAEKSSVDFPTLAKAVMEALKQHAKSA